MVICDELVKEAGLTSVRRWTLYTDKYYTSMALSKHMFNKYGCTNVGTIVPKDKKSRADHDISFLNLSNGASNGLQKGW